jgi:hypothetical protein
LCDVRWTRKMRVKDILRHHQLFSMTSSEAFLVSQNLNSHRLVMRFWGFVGITCEKLATSWHSSCRNPFNAKTSLNDLLISASLWYGQLKSIKMIQTITPILISTRIWVFQLSNLTQSYLVRWEGEDKLNWEKVWKNVSSCGAEMLNVLAILSHSLHRFGIYRQK